MFAYNRTKTDLEQERVNGPQVRTKWVHEPTMKPTSMSMAFMAFAQKASDSGVEIPDVLMQAKPVFFRDVTPSTEKAHYGDSIESIINRRQPK